MIRSERETLRRQGGRCRGVAGEMDAVLTQGIWNSTRGCEPQVFRPYRQECGKQKNEGASPGDDMKREKAAGMGLSAPTRQA